MKGGGGLTKLASEACFRAAAAAFLAGAAFEKAPKLQLFTAARPSGPERSDGDAASKASVRRQPLPPLSGGAHENGCGALHPPSPLPLFASLRFVFNRGGRQISFITTLSPPPSLPPFPSELYRWRCLWGGRQDVRPTGRSKSP